MSVKCKGRCLLASDTVYFVRQVPMFLGKPLFPCFAQKMPTENTDELTSNNPSHHKSSHYRRSANFTTAKSEVMHDIRQGSELEVMLMSPMPNPKLEE